MAAPALLCMVYTRFMFSIHIIHSHSLPPDFPSLKTFHLLAFCVKVERRKKTHQHFLFSLLAFLCCFVCWLVITKFMNILYAYHKTELPLIRCYCTYTHIFVVVVVERPIQFGKRSRISFLLPVTVTVVQQRLDKILQEFVVCA